MIQEDDSAGPLYILLSGKVKAYSYSGDGEEVTYGIYTPIDLVGEMWFDGSARSESVISQEDCECAVLIIGVPTNQIAIDTKLSLWLIKRVV